MYQGQPWHRYCKTSDNRLSRLIGPNGAYPDVTRLSGIYCIVITVITSLQVKNIRERANFYAKGLLHKLQKTFLHISRRILRKPFNQQHCRYLSIALTVDLTFVIFSYSFQRTFTPVLVHAIFCKGAFET